MESLELNPSNSFFRQLSHLKLVSRLLAHELHSQSNAKQLTLSRDEVAEMKTSIDLFIEEVTKRQGGAGGGGGLGEGRPTLVSGRN